MFACARDAEVLAVSYDMLRRAAVNSAHEVVISVCPDNGDTSWVPKGIPVVGCSRWREAGEVRVDAVVSSLSQAMERDGSDVAFKLDCDVAFLGVRWLDHFADRIAAGYIAGGCMHNGHSRPHCFFGMCYWLTKAAVESMFRPRCREYLRNAAVVLAEGRSSLPEDLAVSTWIRYANPNEVWIESKGTGKFPVMGWSVNAVSQSRKNKPVEMVHLGQGGYALKKSERGAELAERCRAFLPVLEERLAQSSGATS